MLALKEGAEAASVDSPKLVYVPGCNIFQCSPFLSRQVNDQAIKSNVAYASKKEAVQAFKDMLAAVVGFTFSTQ